ncbi:ABC transporter substrate-binding protein [Bradyrhizobium guangdongense]|uniref:ABC transporter substrate-binding protein n=1 Tax=Bradyrhizobium guangdongense TaxID=1325090 RepID=A0A410V3P5_9BRAD|nr:ABC transporter substrate-binding protein [Bradyrhizobium guangdongense]QAU38309.1 ABC transporter substrate-binding protein [Bradyrhizobium guangdongense]QOZ59364.1 ABC transporter substrate-binding protein [Bradyrhizobium guangdongense]GGI33177.1 ABC transporter substrate-binding protein [Bradyrhizobium guangdongense]
MRRREFIVSLSALATIGRSRAQDQVRHVGVLVASPRTEKALEAALEQRGWTLGRNLQIEARITGGDTDRTRQGARELIELKPDVLFAETNTSMAALHAEGTTIPTVFVMVSDPVGMHYVESLSNPGRNVTGFTPFEPSLGGKWVSLLKEIAPNIEHIGLVYNPEPGNNSAAFRKSIDQIADKSGIASVDTPTGNSADIERLIHSLKDRPNSGLIFLPDALTTMQSDQIVALVAQSRLPAIYPLRLFCLAGGLMSYGVDINKIHVGGASYVDRILRGVDPSKLPVQAPTELELVVNQRTAKQLGLQLPATLLARADEVIE